MSYNQSKDPLADFFRKIQQEFKKRGSGPGNNNGGLPGLLLLIGVVFLLATVWTSFYQVEPEEEAVVLRFGKWVETNGSGLHFKLPLGVDQVIKVKTQEQRQHEFGFRSRGRRGEQLQTTSRGYEDEALMLTGDLNVVDVNWTVQYRISDAKEYLFNAKDSEQTIRDVAEAIMRRVIGDRFINDVIQGAGRTQLSLEAEELMQEVMDRYKIGIKIDGVRLQKALPPEPVRPAFNEVNAAKQEQESMINQAEREYNRVIPAARGSAEQTISEAQGYAMAAVNRAKGDAEKFVDTLKAYRVAPSVTKQRIYLETMESLLQQFEEIVVVDEKVEGLMPIFQNMMSNPPARPQARQQSLPRQGVSDGSR